MNRVAVGERAHRARIVPREVARLADEIVEDTHVPEQHVRLGGLEDPARRRSISALSGMQRRDDRLGCRAAVDPPQAQRVDRMFAKKSLRLFGIAGDRSSWNQTPRSTEPSDRNQ